MILAVDIGNTNIKCKAWEDEQVLFVKSFPASSVDELVDHLNGIFPDLVVLASVGSFLVERRLKELFYTVKILHVISDPYCMGVFNGYELPDKLGVDRWLAVIEAFNLSSQKACGIFDLGTAITLDVVDADGKHQGGYIVPGLTLMSESLFNATQKVRYVSEEITDLDYGKNTAQAVERGIFSLILAWVISEINHFKMHYPDGFVYLTGGAAKSILPFLPCDVIYHEDLVLDALKRVASS